MKRSAPYQKCHDNWCNRITPMKCKCDGSLVGETYSENRGGMNNNWYCLTFVTCDKCHTVFGVEILPKYYVPGNIYPFYGPVHHYENKQQEVKEDGHQ